MACMEERGFRTQQHLRTNACFEVSESIVEQEIREELRRQSVGVEVHRRCFIGRSTEMLQQGFLAR